MITDEMLDNWFTHHPPKDEDIVAYKTIRDAGKTFAKIVRDHTPESADQTVAIRKIREAVMNANAARACHQEDDDDHVPVEIDGDGNIVSN